ncbi:MAG: HmuY family protein [Rhodothermaceae bacterium]
MKKFIQLFLIAMMFSFVTAQEKTVTIDATSFTDWVYFSFEKGDTLSIVDPSTSDQWDLALMRYHFRTNGGSSGSGQAGVIDLGVVDFDGVKQAQESGYVVDDSISIYSMATHTYTKIPGSAVLETWVTKDMTTMPPTYSSKNKVFLVKTAKGKYAKLIVENYYNDQAIGGHITFKYFYQPNGSTSLDVTTGIEETVVPTNFTLEQNYPNPFNPMTTVDYSLTERMNVKIRIFDITGKEVASLVNKEQEAGNYSVKWSATDKSGAQLATGIYFCVMSGGNNETFKVIKMSYIK